MDRGRPINLDAVLSSTTEHWSPRTFAVVNDYDARVAKVQGEFTRHRHPDTDDEDQPARGGGPTWQR